MRRGIKSHKRIPTIEDQWMVFQGRNEEYSMVIRKNMGLEKIAGKGFLNIRSGISFEILNPKKDGFPTESENEILYRIEDEIFKKLDGKDSAFVGIIITTSGFKEFIIYHNHDFEIKEVLKKLQSKFESYNFTSYTKEDKDWKLYKEISNNVP